MYEMQIGERARLIWLIRVIKNSNESWPFGLTCARHTQHTFLILGRFLCCFALYRRGLLNFIANFEQIIDTLKKAQETVCFLCLLLARTHVHRLLTSTLISYDRPTSACIPKFLRRKPYWGAADCKFRRLGFI